MINHHSRQPVEDARATQLSKFIVNATQMQAIETRVFEAGMPVAALMEKVAGLITHWIIQRYQPCSVGILVGPGHNGGDALVVARELHLLGYTVSLFCPFDRLKPLTAQHRQYGVSLGLPLYSEIEPMGSCDLLIDGLFGFGLSRALEDTLAAAVLRINAWQKPIVSIDLPSGIHTDTGAVLGCAIQSTHTLCLGLWKQAFVQAAALPYLGTPTLVDFGLPLYDIQAVIGEQPQVQRLSRAIAIATLPLTRDLNAHKYTVGNLLLIAGSRQYAGAARLAAEGAVASGVGMITLAVPASLQSAMVSALPGLLVLGCPEAPDGSIDQLPQSLSNKLDQFDAIACGPGLTPRAKNVVQTVLDSQVPLVLDADGLNIVAMGTAPGSGPDVSQSPAQRLAERSAPTVITPHPGEFRRLFPDLVGLAGGEQALQAAKFSQSWVVLKGARVAIATPQGHLWFNPKGTPALARGGSGDVLTGLLGGLVAQKLASLRRQSTARIDQPPQTMESAQQVTDASLGAVWWHAQAGIFTQQRRTILGVDPLTLAKALIPTLKAQLDPTLGQI